MNSLGYSTDRCPAVAIEHRQVSLLATNQSSDELGNVAIAIRELHATVIEAANMGVHAVKYSVHRWPVFPLSGKVPAIRGGHGVLDATTDPDIVAAWWGGPYVGCNIGGRIPKGMIALDIDPRHRGLESLGQLEATHGALPKTLTHISGRGDGGRHLFYRRPPGKLSDKRLGPGIDLKTSTGYVVLPPSIHPDTGQPYQRIDATVAAPPSWLASLLLPEPVRPPERTARRRFRLAGESIADSFSASTSWADILHPHGWRCLDADPDADGTRWRHPRATTPSSATVRHGCLFVYSTNTPFDATTPGDQHGYTRFRAHAVLNHDGDLSAAARALTGKTVA